MSSEEPLPPPDGRYDVIVVDADGPAAGHGGPLLLEVAVTAGPARGQVMAIEVEHGSLVAATGAAAGLDAVDPLDALGLPGRLDVVDGRPTLRLDAGPG